eukprot:m.75831 g.75831  ORF g.75831 m.75831 type:complete len:91 (-) comp12523_c0_seq10:390-662(-)
MEFNDPDLRVLGPEEENTHLYTGALDISDMPELLSDLQPMPDFLSQSVRKKDGSFDSEYHQMIWIANGDIDSGVIGHYKLVHEMKELLGT